MKYLEILQELEEIGLKNKFISEFESNVSESFLLKIKETDKIYSTGSLIRSLIKFYEYKSDRWEYWKEVLLYFMTPIDFRDKNKLPN